MALQRALLQLFELRYELVRHTADRGTGDIQAIKLGNMADDALIAHSEAEVEKNLAFDLVGQVGWVLSDQLGFKRTSTVARRLQIKTARRGLDGFTGKAVLAVRIFFNLKMGSRSAFNAASVSCLINGVNMTYSQVRS